MERQLAHKPKGSNTEGHVDWFEKGRGVRQG